MSANGNGKITSQHIRAMKGRGQRITMLTAYDATFARIVDGAGVDAVLVGDSLGMVIQGHQSTLSVRLDHMVYHCAAVARGVKRAHVVGDMPFMSYQASAEDAVRNAGRLVQEGCAEAVKMEGGMAVAESVRRIAACGIPVMGHVGLTPQSVHAFGGYKVQGKSNGDAERVFRDAQAIQEAGAYSIVLEGIPAELAARITESLSIPTIGIGAGPCCDGQVLVIYDLLGMDPEFNPKFLKKYANLHETINSAVLAFAREVRGGAFPGKENSF
jgi:3-methyl-2-oxobutanoate hydroxymethyltransferase